LLKLNQLSNLLLKDKLQLKVNHLQKGNSNHPQKGNSSLLQVITRTLQAAMEEITAATKETETTKRMMTTMVLPSRE